MSPYMLQVYCTVASQEKYWNVQRVTEQSTGFSTIRGVQFPIRYELGICQLL